MEFIQNLHVLNLILNLHVCLYVNIIFQKKHSGMCKTDLFNVVL